MDDGGQTGFSKDDIGGTTGGIGSTLDGDSDVGTGQSRGIVSTVTSHGAQMAETLEALDDLVLVLGEDSSETVGIHDHLVERSVLAARGGSVLEHLGGVHVVAQSKTAASFLSDSELISSDHLDTNAKSDGVVDRLLGIVARRVVDGEKTNELESITLSLEIVTVKFLVGNSESTKTTGGVLLDVLLKLVLDFLGLVARAEFDDDTSHTLSDTLELASGLLAVGDLGTLVDGVKRLEVEELDSSTGASSIAEGSNDRSIDGVLVLGTRSVGGEKNDILSGEGAVGLDGIAIDGKLVGGQSTGLVRAQDGDTSKFLDSGDTGDDGLVLGELLSTDGEGDGQDSGHGNGDTTDQEDQDVVETAAVLEAEAGVEDENFRKNEDTDGDKAERTDLSENLLQVTSGVVILADEGGGTTEESVGTGGDNDTPRLHPAYRWNR